jgi:thiol-disulfide isomerase/thioredoxin
MPTLILRFVVFLLVCAACAPVPQAQPLTAPPSVGTAQAVVIALPTHTPLPPLAYRADPASIVASTGRPQLLKVYNVACAVCQAMLPVMHALEPQYSGRLDFVYLHDQDPANRQVFNTYGMLGYPIFTLITPEGEMVTQWFGTSKNQTEIATLLNNYLATLNG